jgi:hypothetical protein
MEVVTLDADFHALLALPGVYRAISNPHSDRRPPQPILRDPSLGRDSSPA